VAGLAEGGAEGVGDDAGRWNPDHLAKPTRAAGRRGGAWQRSGRARCRAPAAHGAGLTRTRMALAYRNLPDTGSCVMPAGAVQCCRSAAGSGLGDRGTKPGGRRGAIDKWPPQARAASGGSQ
jgi:hypothetical protein